MRECMLVSPVVGHRKEKVHSISFDRYRRDAVLIERIGYRLAIQLIGWHVFKRHVSDREIVLTVSEAGLTALSSIGSREEVFPHRTRTRLCGLPGKGSSPCCR